MNSFQLVTFAIAVSAFIMLCFTVWHEWKLRRIMQNLDTMLDAAADNNFSAHMFDETLLSAVENKLANFLAASQLSARNIDAERNKVKELISDISHQTKTPIANVLLYSQLLSEQNLSGEGRKCIRSLINQAEKLRFLIDSLVKLSRLETGILTLHPKVSPLQPMLHDVREQFTPKADAQGITLSIVPADSNAVFDPKWTLEALGNIVDNAIKYTPSGGRVELSVIHYDLFCRIDVTDTGIGITEDELPRLFARFYRSPSQNTQEGVGIGLYLARQILSGQGGYIKVTSTPGKGSVFSMFLPAGQ